MYQKNAHVYRNHYTAISLYFQSQFPSNCSDKKIMTTTFFKQSSLCGLGKRIWTSGLLNPIQARYQTAPYPVKWCLHHAGFIILNIITKCKSFFHFFAIFFSHHDNIHTLSVPDSDFNIFLSFQSISRYNNINNCFWEKSYGENFGVWQFCCRLDGARWSSARPCRNCQR